jgi:hypothetical protein
VKAWGANLSAQLNTLREILPDLKDRQALARRANDAEAPANLSGKCILCVGGRSGAVDAYRREVEQRGGKQCLFIKSSGVSSFGRIVSAACVPVEATSTTGTSC